MKQALNLSIMDAEIMMNVVDNNAWFGKKMVFTFSGSTCHLLFKNSECKAEILVIIKDVKEGKKGDTIPTMSRKSKQNWFIIIISRGGWWEREPFGWSREMPILDSCTEDDKEKQKEIDNAYEHFALLVIKADGVEYLELKPQPNRRTQWHRKGGEGDEWDEIKVCPWFYIVHGFATSSRISCMIIPIWQR